MTTAQALPSCHPCPVLAGRLAGRGKAPWVVMWAARRPRRPRLWLPQRRLYEGRAQRVWRQAGERRGHHLGRLLCGGWRNRANRRPPAPQTQPVATPLHPPFHPRCPSRVVGSVWTACRPRGQWLAMRLAAPPPCWMGIVQESPRRLWRGQRGVETSSLAAGRQMSRGVCPTCRTSPQHPLATCLTRRRRRRLHLRCSRWPVVWPRLAWAAMERRPALPTPPCRWAHTIRLDRRRCRCH
jgi:hypothetical protein